MVHICDCFSLGANMSIAIINIQRHNVFAEFLRALKKGYVLNTKLARVEVNKYYMNLN